MILRGTPWSGGWSRRGTRGVEDVWDFEQRYGAISSYPMVLVFSKKSVSRSNSEGSQYIVLSWWSFWVQMIRLSYLVESSERGLSDPHDMRLKE